MHHIKPISQSRRVQPAITLLEKQAMSDMILQNLSQIAAFLSLVAGLKPQEGQ